MVMSTASTEYVSISLYMIAISCLPKICGKGVFFLIAGIWPTSVLNVSKH